MRTKNPEDEVDWSGDVWKCGEPGCGQYIGDDYNVINGPLRRHTAKCKASWMLLIRKAGKTVAAPGIVLTKDY